MKSTARDLLLRLGVINVYKRGEQRAPHKPLYLLLLLAHLQRNEPRLVPFTEVRSKLNEALRMFAPRVATVNAHYPFWRLQNDGLADVVYRGQLRIRQSSDDPTATSLIECQAQGGLKQDDYELLVGDLDLQSLVAHKILDAHFPYIIHGDVVNFFGLRLNTPHKTDNANYGEFSSAVLGAYQGRCAISNIELSYCDATVGLDATHICWPQIGGNDIVSNGIAMTSLHARLFHLGVFTITPDYSVRISSLAKLSTGASALGLSNGHRIAAPKSKKDHPSIEALVWHNKSVFRG